MTRKTTHSGSNLPKLAVYNKSGLIVATSYKRHASGQIEFWNFRDRKLITLSIKDFEANYTTKVFL